MHESSPTIKEILGVKWIKSDSGSTWLCPIGALDGIESPTEADLRSRCINESENPQND